MVVMGDQNLPLSAFFEGFMRDTLLNDTLFRVSYFLGFVVPGDCCCCTLTFISGVLYWTDVHSCHACRSFDRDYPMVFGTGCRLWLC